MTCAQARVPDPTKVCVAVGLGFFVELTLDEALTFISKKDADLNKQVRNLLTCISLIFKCFVTRLRSCLGSVQN